ncbi:site-specific integrase, partial [Pararhizobium sp.]|uniref:site-specific integrase n=1 Tax=Pararhizobium sp. TaxID=1977563 RepID=UPI00271C9162
FVTIDKSLGVKIPFQDWDSRHHQVLNNPFHQKHFSEMFDEYKQKIMGGFYLLSQNNVQPSLREIVDLAFAESEKKTYSLFAVFSDFLLKMEKHNKLPRQRSNLLKHQTCLKHLRSFVKHHLNVNDMSFNRINRNFVDEFEIYLKNECKNGHNATMKLLQIFKKVYRIAVDSRWTSHNAFAGKSLSYKDADIEVLSENEIQLLKRLDIKKAYIQKTRELFLFCIYTGVAYVDLQNLQRNHIELNIASGQYIIRKKREKTGVEFILPLFHPAHELLSKWSPGWEKTPAATYLSPKISNQKFNCYLKELIALMGIQKKVTVHCGRHTFATTVALENGVPIESVSKMLGHSKISQTQKYAKVTSLKIERETKMLAEILKR